MQLVTAPSGAGKSTLVEQSAAQLGDSVRLALGRAERAAEGADPLLPFRDVIVALVGSDGKLPGRAKEAGRRLAEGAGELMPDIIGTIFPPLGLVLKAGMIGRKATRGGKDPAHARADFVAGLEQFIEALPEEQLVVVAVDDFHWADEATSDLVLYLARRVARKRFKLTLLTRPIEHQAPHVVAALAELARLDAVERLDLRSFDAHDVDLLLSAVFDGAEVDVRTSQLLVERSGGNPYVLQKWVTHLSAVGALGVDHGLVRANERRLSELPEGLGPLLDAMLAGLGEDVRDLLEAGATLGPSFDPAIAAHLADADPTDALRALHRVERSTDWLEPDGELLRFDHALLREHIYATIAPALRREMHSRAADALFDLDAAPGVVGAHLLSAGRADDAAPFQLEAADDDLASGNFRSAAARMSDMDPPRDFADRDRFRSVQLRAQVGAGDVAAASHTIRRWQDETPVLPAGAALQRAELLHFAGRYDEAIAAVKVLREEGHPQAVIRTVHYLRFSDPAAAERRADQQDTSHWPPAARRQWEYVVAANVLLQRDRVDEARRRLSAVLAGAEADGHDDQAAAAARRLAEIAIFNNDLVSAEALVRSGRQRAELVGSRQRLYLLVTAAELARHQGDLTRADRLLGVAEPQLALLGIPLWIAHVHLARAQVQRVAGEPLDAALTQARAIYDQHQAGWGLWHVDATVALANGAIDAGLAEAARRHGLKTEERWLTAGQALGRHPLMFL